MKTGSHNILLVSSIIFASILGASSAHSEQLKVDSDIAKQIVNDYKALRSYCSLTQDQARRDCFSKLSATTSDYKVAKFFLSKQESQTNTIADAQTNW